MPTARIWCFAIAAALLEPFAATAAPITQEAILPAAPPPDCHPVRIDPAVDRTVSVDDPWEPLNRKFFAIHESIDRAVLGPAARGYRAVTPQFVRTRVSNFLFNISSPTIFANDVLQAEPKRAATTFARFGIKSTMGILGLFDVAEHMGLERHDEDFGQTLAAWGITSGPYIFIPVLGPSDVRDSVGKVVDFFIDPFAHAEFDGADTFRSTRTVIGGLSARESLIETIDNVRENSLDAYVSYRTSFTLR